MFKSAEKFGGSTVIRQWVPDRRSANAKRFLSLPVLAPSEVQQVTTCPMIAMCVLVDSRGWDDVGRPGCQLIASCMWWLKACSRSVDEQATSGGADVAWTVALRQLHSALALRSTAALQLATWVLLTAYNMNLPTPYPTVPSPTLYDVPFSHNTKRYRQTTDGQNIVP